MTENAGVRARCVLEFASRIGFELRAGGGLSRAPLLEPYKILYIEEPAVPGNIEVFKRLKEAIRIPLAVGEQARTIWDVVPYLQEGVADILEIDCAHTGGMSQLKKIATLGEATRGRLPDGSIGDY